MVYRLILLLAGLASLPCSAEFRDPTQPAYPLPAAEANTVGAVDLVLSAIWLSAHSRRATINGVLAKPGQTITIQQPSVLPTPENTAPVLPLKTTSATIKIITIQKNSVIISQNGELKTLQLVQRPYK